MVLLFAFILGVESTFIAEALPVACCILGIWLYKLVDAVYYTVWLVETGCGDVIEKGILINKLITKIILICSRASLEILRLRRDANIDQFLDPSNFTV